MPAYLACLVTVSAIARITIRSRNTGLLLEPFQRCFVVRSTEFLYYKRSFTKAFSVPLANLMAFSTQVQTFFCKKDREN